MNIKPTTLWFEDFSAMLKRTSKISYIIITIWLFI